MTKCAVCEQVKVGQWYTPIPEPDGYTCPGCVPTFDWWRWTWQLGLAIEMTHGVLAPKELP